MTTQQKVIKTKLGLLELTAQGGVLDFAGRRARRVAASRPQHVQPAAQGARGEARAGRARVDRAPAGGDGARTRPPRGARRVRERGPGVLRRPGHVLRRHGQGRGPRLPGLPANVHRPRLERHLRQLSEQKTALTAAELLNDRGLPCFEEHGRAFRTKVYASIEALQADLDEYLVHYNTERPHQGRWCDGKTPMETFLDSVGLALEKYHARQATVA